MYESPIEFLTTQLKINTQKFIEEQVLNAVQGVGVNVNRHELEKALQYDRGQYKKGYADGIKEFAERLNKEAEEIEIDREGDFVETNDRLYDTVDEWCKTTSDRIIKEMVGEG